jgi:glycine/D-amino acid oxidase-like deaminating enzyme
MEAPNQDVIVIGAGVIGLATAYELAKRGLQVTILEQREPGWAASHGNAGMIFPSAGEPMINPHHMMAGQRTLAFWYDTCAVYRPDVGGVDNDRPVYGR